MPGWAYVLIIVAVAYGVYYYRSRSNGAAVGSPVSASVASNNGVETPVSATSPASTYNGTNTTENAFPSANTNAIWARNTTNSLVSQGSDPTLVSNAVSKYLSGAALTAAERAVINTAITKFGVPPEGVIAVKETPAPAPKPAAPKPAPKPAAPKPAPSKAAAPKATLYTVRPGDSLSAIAGRFYNNSALWSKIYSANRAKIGGNPNLIYAGTVLTIPK